MMVGGAIHGGEKVVGEVGNYYLQKTDSFYGMYSGYNFIVCWSRGFCHKQLDGFKDLDVAKQYLKTKAKEGKEDKDYEETKLSILKDPSPSNWKCECGECGKEMSFDEDSFVYKCECGYRLEV